MSKGLGDFKMTSCMKKHLKRASTFPPSPSNSRSKALINVPDAPKLNLDPQRGFHH